MEANKADAVHPHVADDKVPDHAEEIVADDDVAIEGEVGETSGGATVDLHVDDSLRLSVANLRRGEGRVQFREYLAKCGVVTFKSAQKQKAAAIGYVSHNADSYLYCVVSWPSGSTATNLS